MGGKIEGEGELNERKRSAYGKCVNIDLQLFFLTKWTFSATSKIYIPLIINKYAPIYKC